MAGVGGITVDTFLPPTAFCHLFFLAPFLGANWSSLRETADPYNRNRYSHFIIEQTHLIKLASQVSQSQVEHGAAGQWPWPRLTP